MQVFELNLDGLVGPTHNYAGLASGNLASMSNALMISSPKMAALQGLAKMRLLHQMGFKQGLLPPHERPNLFLLEQLGFTGNPEQKLRKAAALAPEILAAAFSASSMWTANAATVTPSIDANDGKLHFTPANLVSNLHRHQEASFSNQVLRRIFHDEQYFHHHPPLPASLITSDEGAANHNRIAMAHCYPGLHLFVYGKKAIGSSIGTQPQQFPARQTLEASAAIARSHQLDPNRVLFACQNPQVIDHGVFHHDVIGVANEHVIFLHEEALVNQKEILQDLRDRADFELHVIEATTEQLSVTDAVSSYLFNSQLLTKKDGSMILIAPIECEQNERVKQYIDSVLAAKNPITECRYLDLKQSMSNGGGPACLRLRVALTDIELRAMHQGILLNDDLFDQLEKWINKYYRDELKPNDLVSTAFINETRDALDELTRILKLGSIYPFQQEFIFKG